MQECFGEKFCEKGVSIMKLGNFVIPTVTEEDNNGLTSIITNLEIKEVVSQCRSDKS